MGAKRKSGISKYRLRTKEFDSKTNYLNYLGFERSHKNKKPKWIGRFGTSS